MVNTIKDKSINSKENFGPQICMYVKANSFNVQVKDNRKGGKKCGKKSYRKGDRKGDRKDDRFFS